MISKIFYNEESFISLDIPENANIGCFMSGGADSSLLCFLLAETIEKNNLNTKIFPITTEFLQRPYNLRCAYDVVEKIKELTGHKFGLHPCFIMPNHRRKISDDEKVVIMSEYTRTYSTHFRLATMFNGLTANPPVSALPDTMHAHRQTCRDEKAWREEQEKKKGLSVPFIHVDKRAIGQLYKKYGLLNSLLPLTRSCEAEREESCFFTKDCFEIRPRGQECWWCLERNYGFSNL